MLFPVYTTVIAAFKPSDQILENPLLPDAFTLDVLADAWSSGRLGRYLLNSLIVASLVTVCQVVTSVLAAYAFAILDFPGRNVLFVVFLATLLVPLEATLVVTCERRLARLAELVSGSGRAVSGDRVRRVLDASGVPDVAARPP